MLYPHLHEEPFILARPLPHHGVSAEIKDRTGRAAAIGRWALWGPRSRLHGIGQVIQASSPQVSCGLRPEAEAREPGMGSGTASGGQGTATSTEGQSSLVPGSWVRIPGRQRMSSEASGAVCPLKPWSPYPSWGMPVVLLEPWGCVGERTTPHT